MRSSAPKLGSSGAVIIWAFHMNTCEFVCGTQKKKNNNNNVKEYVNT